MTYQSIFRTLSAPFTHILHALQQLPFISSFPLNVRYSDLFFRYIIRTPWLHQVRCVPRSAYFVNLGTTFLSENIFLIISLPLNHNPTHKLSLKYSTPVNNTDVEEPNPYCKPKFDTNCKLVPRIWLVNWNVVVNVLGEIRFRILSTSHRAIYCSDH